MEDGKDFYGSAFDFVGDEIWSARDDELTSSRVASQAPETRIAAQAVNGGDNAFGDGERGFRFVLFDVGANFGEICDGGRGPNYSHEGGASSLPEPQERSQRRTKS